MPQCDIVNLSNQMILDSRFAANGTSPKGTFWILLLFVINNLPLMEKLYISLGGNN
jgi:hypothetical protein